MWSTWCSFHQDFTEEQILTQCRLAKEAGCTTLLLDDGWQTLDTGRGYAFTGDWEPERIPDMKGFVRAVHDLGMRAVLWCGLPFVGVKNRAHQRFAGKFLADNGKESNAILDPRHPEVREHLLEMLTQRTRDWEIDGWFLDFIDSYRTCATTPSGAVDGRDISDVDEAADLLMHAISERLRQIRPDVLIEFRQHYVGPRMQGCANLLRAVDCPNDATRNRARTQTLRHIAPASTVCGDVLLWHPDAPAEAAARQILSVLFAVPQVSVRLDRLPVRHMQMVRFWLGWWTAHRDCLLDGSIHSEAPEAGWPLVVTDTARERIVAVYLPRMIALTPAIPQDLWLVNATTGTEVVIDVSEDAGERVLVVRDCTGAVVAEQSLVLNARLHRLSIPASGLAHLRLV